MPSTLSFNWRTAVLLFAGLQLLAIAGAIGHSSVNRAANRCLALLLIVLAGLLVPDVIGFAGFYDAYPWLSFAPFAIPLAVGPLFYLYSFALTHGGRLERAGWHMAPALAQFAYKAASFALPLPLKNRWDALATPIVEPIVTAGVILGLAGYGIVSLGLFGRYRRELANLSGDDERFAVRWLSRCAAAMLVLLAIWLGYDAYDLLVTRLTYFGAFWLHLAIAAIGCYLGIEGWRHADRRFPAIDALKEEQGDVDRPLDWRALGEGWAAQTRDRAWYRDSDVTIAALARHLGTNSNYLSRAINIGLGVNFSTFVADLRSEDVAAALRAGRTDDLLTLALDAGFGSKASFNRAFQARFGESPTAYRRRCGSNPE